MDKRKIISSFLCCIVIVSLFISVTILVSASSVYSVNVPSEMTYGETYRLPKISVEVDGETVEAQTVLYKPDGTKTESSSVTLNQAGLYTIDFLYNGKQVAERKSFLVRYPYYVFKSKSSSAQYVDGVGLRVKTQSGVRMDFNEVVDISSASGSSVLFQMFVEPTIPGTEDFNRFDLIITDIYDVNNYLTIHVENTTENGHTHSYIRAGAPSQPLTGRENWNPEKIHAQGAYGTPVKFTFRGNPENEASNVLTFYYDYESKCLYANDAYLVVDFDEKKYFSKLWDGFTNGKVRFSVVPAGGSNANYVITNMYGMDLRKTIFTDTKEPILEIDVPTEIPKAKAGVGYKIFESTAIDDYAGNLDVTVKAYYNYYSNNKYSIAVKNGEFIPPRAGGYTLEYSAVDYFGNKKVSLVDVQCLAQTEPIIIELVEDQQTGKAGEWIDIADAYAKGGSGEKTIDFIVESDDGKGFEVKDGKFKPYSSGEYTVVYTAVDYLGDSVSISVDVDVEENLNPIFEDEFNIPKYFIANAKYSLPEVYATDFNNGMAKIKAKIIATDANGEKEIEGEYLPAVALDGELITIKYVAESATGKDERIFEVPVYDVGMGVSLNSSKYFVSDKEVTKEFVSTGIKFTTKKDATVNFINPVLADKFEFSFTLNSSTLDTFKLVLEDKYDETQKFYIAFNQKNGAIVADINGVSSAVTDYKFTANAMDVVLAYDAIGKQIKIGSKYYEVANLPEFTSGYVFVSWQFIGLDGKCEFLLKKLNNQVFRVDDYDITNPQISLVGERSAKLFPGDTATTPTVRGGDVLDPLVVSTLTVRGPDKKIVKEKSTGIPLENVDASVAYSFVCSSYGNYSVVYTVADSSGNPTSITYVVKVWDDIVPEITLSADSISAKVGEEVVLPTATAEDNVSGKCDVYIVINTPSNRMVHVGDKYKFEEKGVYTVIYYSFDNNGNMAKRSITVNVL